MEPEILSEQIPQEPIPQVAKSYRNTYALVSILFLTISLFVTGYFIDNANNKQQIRSEASTNPTAPIEPSPTISPSETPAPTLTADELSQWKTYQSPKYRYQVRFPTDWVATPVSQTDPQILEYITFSPLTPSNTTHGVPISLTVTTRTYQQVISLNSLTGSAINVASVSGLESQLQDSEGHATTQVTFPFGSNTVILVAQQQYEETLNQMVSTFKQL